MEEGARLQLSRLIELTADTFFYVRYDDLEIRISAEDLLPEIELPEDPDESIDYKGLFFDTFRKHTVAEDVDKWDYVEDSEEIGQYTALEIYDYIKAAVFQMKIGKRYWGAQAALSLVSSYEFRSRFEGEVVLKGGDPRTLSPGAYLSGVENFVTRNAEDDLREAYLILFNAKDKETHDVAWKVVEKILETTMRPKTVTEIKMSSDYKDMKENQKVKGQLLPDTLG